MIFHWKAHSDWDFLDIFEQYWYSYPALTQVEPEFHFRDHLLRTISYYWQFPPKIWNTALSSSLKPRFGNELRITRFRKRNTDWKQRGFWALVQSKAFPLARVSMVAWLHFFQLSESTNSKLKIVQDTSWFKELKFNHSERSFVDILVLSTQIIFKARENDQLWSFDLTWSPEAGRIAASPKDAQIGVGRPWRPNPRKFESHISPKIMEQQHKHV